MKLKESKAEHFTVYMIYCSKYAKNLQEFQMLLANARINRYFNRELQKIENEFKTITAGMITPTNRIYNSMIMDVLDYHSPQIIAEETKVKENHYNNVTLN